MCALTLPKPVKPVKAKAKEVYLVASGDLRPVANESCWPEQKKMEDALEKALNALGFKVVRAHPYKVDEKHGFLASQKEGLETFAKIDPHAKLIVAEAVWQYSHHVYPGLLSHQGPILTVANWSGTWPGLVGMLNLNACLTKAGKKYSTLWSIDFTDEWFCKNLQKWLETGEIRHPTKHAVPLAKVAVPGNLAKIGQALADQLKNEKAIMGIFDEGCMGMYNAIIPDELLHDVGVFKERLSQSALYYETTQTSDEEALAVKKWMTSRGMTFYTGSDPDTELTDEQILIQCKMYIAALRIADDFGCDLIGIQYQQGLKDVLPASDLVEGMLNNEDRPPVKDRKGKRELYKGMPLVHFNEVDECAGLDGLMTYRVHKILGQPVENTLHDIRWGDWDQSGSTDDYVWVFLISGAVPPAHFAGGWKGASSMRQDPVYFRMGGGTLRGVSKPGEIVWSRIYVENGKLNMDLGRGGVADLPEEETNRRWNLTTPAWPIMHGVLYGVSRDQLMAKHKANHIHVAYANSAAEADKCMFAKAAMAEAMGMKVNICGTKKNGKGWV